MPKYIKLKAKNMNKKRKLTSMKTKFNTLYRLNKNESS